MSRGLTRSPIAVTCVAVGVFVSALAAGSIAGASAPAAPSRTAVVGIDFDPPCLNVLLRGCNFAVSSTIVGPALAGAFRVLPDFSFEPVLVDRVDVQAQPFALTYHIKQRAVWSDGTPVTADDFIFTVETILDPSNNTLRAGYEHVTQSVKVDSKTVTIRFSAPNPDWRSLFLYVLPKHVLAGHDFNQVWRDEIADPVTHEPIGSGPFLLTGWTKGQALTAIRNPRWWGPTEPRLDSIEFRIASADAQFDGIRDGSIDIIFPHPQLQIADLDRLPGIALQTAPGPAMEHLDFNVGSAEMPLLRESWFRQAVAFSIDRAAVAAETYETLFPNHPALQNLSFSSAQPEYDPVFARYTYDTAAVARIMGDRGCVAGADGIFSCGGTRASVKFATTSGNQLRERAQQDMVGQARAAGIDLVPDNDPAGILLGTRLGARQYELIMFTWVRGAALPSVQALYGCDGELNFMGYCSQAVTDLGARAEVEVDPTVRAQLVNDANRILAEDVPSLPLFLRPALLLQRETLRGPQVNPGAMGTWNVETWRIGDDVTPPETTAVASPAANASGWNNGPVTVELAATDDDTGVREIRYTLAGAQTGGAVVAGDSATVNVTAEGITTLEYFATDASGNVEPVQTLTIRIDKTAPVVVAARSPVANANGWNNENVTARFEATDALSGIDGEASTEVVFTAEGANQSAERSFVDRAGNRASASVSGISIDKTAPVIACVAEPNSIWPPNRRLVPVQVTVTVADGLSGSDGFVLSSTSSDEPGPGDIQGFVVGTPDTSGLVRAERSPRGDGRVYTLEYEGADRAGNTTACAARVEVPRRRG